MNRPSDRTRATRLRAAAAELLALADQLDPLPEVRREPPPDVNVLLRQLQLVQLEQHLQHAMHHRPPRGEA